MRLEPGLGALTKTVLLELHKMPAANTVEETKVKILALEVLIARAEDISRMQIQEMHMMTT